MQTIGNVSREKFLLIAEEVMKRFVKLPENPEPDRTGGFMAVLEKSVRWGPKMLFVNEIGSCRPDMARRCFDYCQEKINRLYHHEQNGHLSAWLSRDTSINHYGGAIRTFEEGQSIITNRIMFCSLSGLSEHGDEAVVIVTCMIFRWLVLSEAKQLISISRNPLFEPLLVACNDLFDYNSVTE